MPLVSKSEAARLAGVTRQTIHRKVKSGELSATGNSIDTSELIRVFGAISDGTEPVTPMSQPDVAVQTTLQARVDGLESQLAVTREQLADTAKDRDEWRDIAKEATSNVKLITNQGGGAKSNDNLMAFAAVAFVVGIGLAYMMLRNDVTPSDNQPEPVVSEGMDSLEQLMWEAGIKPSAPEEYDELIPPPAQVPRTVCSIYDINPFSKYNDAECAIGAIYTKLGKQTELTPTEELASRCLNDGLAGEVDEWIAAKCPEAILELADMYQVELHPNELSGKPEQGATVTAGLVTDPELIERLRYLQAKKVKTMWTIGMQGNFSENLKSLEQVAEEKDIDLSLLQSIDITDEDIADYLDSLNQSIE